MLKAARGLLAAIVLLALAGSASAWSSSSWNATAAWGNVTHGNVTHGNATLGNATSGCSDEIVGYSPWYGVQGESKPLRVQNHTVAWRVNGPLTKLNLYYSWNYKCLQGIKATYGTSAGSARMIGIEKKLYTQHLKLGGGEDVVRVDVKQEPNKCINWIQFHTSKGRSMGFGNSASTSDLQTARPPFKGGFLAFLKGWEDLVEAKNVTNFDVQVAGGLQSLQFVWAAEYCPNSTVPAPFQRPTQQPQPAAPAPAPAAPVAPEAPLPAAPLPSPPAPQSIRPTEGPRDAPQPAAPPAPTPQGQPGAPEDPEYEDDAAPPPAPEVLAPGPPAAPAPSVVYTAPPPAATLFTPQYTQAPTVPVLPVAAQPLCPPSPGQCDTSAQDGEAGFCPVRSPFTSAACEGGCCVSSGRCRRPLCAMNGLGADVIALDFICFGANKGPFGGLNKCKGLRCKLALPGCRSGPLGGNCVGYVAADDGAAINAHARQFIGRPCIEVAAPPHLPRMPRLNVNVNMHKNPAASLEPLGGLPNGHWQQQQQVAAAAAAFDGFGFGSSSSSNATLYASGLWTVCDCTAQHQHPVIPAIPLFGLKKALLGKTHAMFAGLVSNATGAAANALLSKAAGGLSPGVQGCKGPLCALLPLLPLMNVTLDQVQVPMTMLANLTSLLRPHPLNLPPIESIIPQVQLPDVNITIDTPITRPELPTFADCAKYLIEFAKSLRPVVSELLPGFQDKSHTQQLGELAKVASMVLTQLRAEGLDNVGSLMGALPKFKVKDLMQVATNLAPMLAPHITQGPTYNVKLLDIQKQQQQQQMAPAVAAPAPAPLPTTATTTTIEYRQPAAQYMPPPTVAAAVPVPPVMQRVPAAPAAAPVAVTVPVAEQQQLLQQQMMQRQYQQQLMQQQYQQQPQQPVIALGGDDDVPSSLPDDYEVTEMTDPSAAVSAGGLLGSGEAPGGGSWQASQAPQQQQFAQQQQQQQQQLAGGGVDQVAEWANQNQWY